MFLGNLLTRSVIKLGASEAEFLIMCKGRKTSKEKS